MTESDAVENPWLPVKWCLVTPWYVGTAPMAAEIEDRTEFESNNSVVAEKHHF